MGDSDHPDDVELDAIDDCIRENSCQTATMDIIDHWIGVGEVSDIAHCRADDLQESVT
jgi:hypothetical protein